MPRTPEDELVQRIVRSLLDLYILRLIQTEPAWGYRIIKKMQNLFDIKIRHSGLYPLLNSLEEDGLLRSTKRIHKGRERKVYEITPRGIQLIESYYNHLRDQLQSSDLTETEE